MSRAAAVALFVCSRAWGASNGYVDQIVHERILFGETQAGVHVMSLYNSDAGTVRWRVCAEAGTQYAGSCRPLIDREIAYGDLAFYEKAWLQELAKFRDELSQRKTLVRKLIGGPDRDLEAVDRVIQSIKDEGLKGWIRHRTPSRPASPNVSSSATMNELMATLTRALEKAPPQIETARPLAPGQR